MPLISSYACAKLILLGEHAVVYGYPAVAIPFTGLKLRAMIEPAIGLPAGKMHVLAPQLDIDADLDQLPPENLIARTVNLTLHFMDLPIGPTCLLSIHSDIPFSSGLGSSAALSIAIIRALSSFIGHPFNSDEVNALAYQSEQLVHGKPSGIDNTVISYEKPIHFIKGKINETLHPSRDLTFLVADTGVQKSTVSSVSYLANLRASQPDFVNERFVKIAEWVQRGRTALERGDLNGLAEAMNANQHLLDELRLSSSEIDRLVSAAMENGAYSAKLTGGGQGGHILTLVDRSKLEDVRYALQVAGAKQVYQTILKAS